MNIISNYNLKELTSFNVDCNAAKYIEFNNEFELRTTLATEEFQDFFHTNSHFVLGDGSNVLFTKDFPGLVIRANIKHINVVKTTDKHVYVEAGAGVLWDDFVAFVVGKGWFGAENLSLIPGTVGAVPVQNIGAYGVEAASIIDTVYYYSFDAGVKHELAGEDCKFGYRTSIFKTDLAESVLISSVLFRLRINGELNFSYSGVKEAFAQQEEQNLRGFRRAIIAIRQSKLPDPKVLGNAGSFFKNPVVSTETANKLLTINPTMPVYEVQGKAFTKKLSAAWLIESAGLKGLTLGNAAVYEKHALILTNKGNATGKEIHELAQTIQTKVFEKFGVKLEPEVIVL